MSICQQLKQLHLFQMECHREGLSAQADIWVGHSNTQSKRIVSSFRHSLHSGRSTCSTTAQYDHYSDQYEQHDSQASMLQRDPRREACIIKFCYYLKNKIELQEFVHLGVFYQINGTKVTGDSENK